MLLPDIPRGPTWTPEHLNTCLARYVALLPKPARLRFFEIWERRHGRASAARLNDAAKAAHQALCAPKN